MLRKIYSYLIILTGSLVVLVSCDKSDDKIESFSAVVDVSKSSLAADKYSIVTLFSTDGDTFVDYPVLTVGKKYWVKVINRTSDGDEELPCINIDWSDSEPKQNGDDVSNIAEFTVRKSNKIVAKVVGEAHYLAYDASTWAGSWLGTEVGSCCNSKDDNTITQDSSDPNKFIMDNFWGDHVDAYFIFTPSTKSGDQVITLPAQTTSEGGDIAASTGTYDQCKGIFSISCSYTIGGDTYEWEYNFTKK